MRVLMLARGYPPFVIGGIGRHNFELLHGLQRVGVEVTAATIPARRYEQLPGKVKVYREIGTNPDQEESGGSVPAIIRKSTAAFVRTALQVAMVEGKPDLVHCQAQVASEAAEILGRIWRVPYVLTVHSNQLALLDSYAPAAEASEEARLVKEVSSQIAGRSDLTICVSRYVLGELRDDFGVPERKLRLVQNGIDTRPFTASVHREPAAKIRRAARGRKVVLFVGRLVPDKGPQILLRAARKLLLERGRRDLSFFIGGDGRLHRLLRARIDRYKLTDDIFLLGRLSHHEVIDSYFGADLVVMPSLHESFPLTALEALAAGRPFVASRVGGLPEIIEDGNTGFLVDEKTPEAWGDVIESLVDDPETMARCGQNGRALVLDRFSSETMVDETVNVYEEALSLKAAGKK
jgi:glycosyltransferase involved in cell wall biosynthesis